MTRFRPRLLVFVVAYEAESTLQTVLDRIPESVFENFDSEVLVIDDSSRDHTFEVGVRSAEASRHPVTVLFNRTNQGYGGNQKLGYQYALRNAFDFVVLLHADGQYAPESIPDLLRPLVDGSADAVFGSRLLTRGAARRGGMPAYKFVGNKILTRIQNALLKSSLSEFHSGFRAYRVSSLAKLPFEYNSNDFHFDTDIIIQLMLGSCSIVEVPIPTYYGDEICRVNGIRYAVNVIRSTVASRFHLLNIFYDRKFDVAPPSNRHYDLKLGYPSSHTMALDAVAPGSRVLDIGCGPGFFASELRKKGCAVTGVDRFEPVCHEAFERVVIGDEKSGPLDLDLRAFDYVLLLDVIEHLIQPEAFLEHLRFRASSLDGKPTFVVTTGNVVFGIVRLQALFGNFNYGMQGILDLTHTRLYTFKSVCKLFRQCGFEITRLSGIPAPFPKAFGSNIASRALVRINSWLIAVAKGVFSYQILLVANPLPTLDALLDDSVEASKWRKEGAHVSAGSVRPANSLAAEQH